jgi:hypothetical protein
MREDRIDASRSLERAPSRQSHLEILRRELRLCYCQRNGERKDYAFHTVDVGKRLFLRQILLAEGIFYCPPGYFQPCPLIGGGAVKPAQKSDGWVKHWIDVRNPLRALRFLVIGPIGRFFIVYAAG